MRTATATTTGTRIGMVATDMVQRVVGLVVEPRDKARGREEHQGETEKRAHTLPNSRTTGPPSMDNHQDVGRAGLVAWQQRVDPPKPRVLRPRRG